MIFAAIISTGSRAQNRVRWTLSDENNLWSAVYVDKAWEFDNDGRPAGNGSIGRSLSSDNVQLVDCKNTISFCVWTWENIEKDIDDAHAEDIRLYLRCTPYYDWMYLFRTDSITGNGGNDNEWPSIYDTEGKVHSFKDNVAYMSLSGTYKVSRRMYGNNDGRIYEFFSIQYKEGSYVDYILKNYNFYFTLYVDVCSVRDTWDQKTGTWLVEHEHEQLEDIPKADVIEHGWVESEDGSGKPKYYVKLNHLDNIAGYGLESSGCGLQNFDQSETTLYYNFPNCANLGTDIMSNGNIDVLSYRTYDVNTNFYYEEAKNGLKTKFHSTRNIAMKKMLYPSTLSASNLNDGTVQLSWTVDKVNSEDVDMSKFIVQCSSDANFDNITETKEITYKKDKEGAYTCLMNIPDRNKGEKTYYFRLRRKNATWDYPRIQTEITLNTDYKKIAGMSSSQEGTKAVITWTLTDDGLWSDDELAYSLEYEGGTSITPHDTSHTEKVSLSICEPTLFTLKLLANGNVYSSSTTKIVLANIEDGKIEKISASKGYFSSYVKLKWEADKDNDNITYYTIDRKELNSGDESFTHLGTVDHRPGVNSYNYNDNSSIAGTYYKYRIQAYQKCYDSTNVVHSLSDVGLAQPYGTVSGRITYKGGVSVKDVKVIAEGETAGKNLAVFLPANKQSLLLDSAKSANLFSEKEGTIQFWDKHVEQTLSVVQFAQGLSFKFSPNLFHVKMRTPKEDSEFMSFTITDPESYEDYGNYNHFTLSYKSTDAVNYDINLYINGKLVKNRKWVKTNLNSHVNDSVGELVFIGANNYIDELRCWNRALDSAEIVNNYDSYISGNEEGLTAYYRCNEEVEDMLFDISKTGNNYNDRHFKIESGALHIGNTEHIVPRDKLALKTYTDEDGNYMINNIPYTEDGSRYSITPLFGVHDFNPGQSPLFFNTSANTHNNIDFKDVSSFKVSGKITYAGGEYPVEGVQISIDGLAASKDGKIITTNAEGEYEVEVPIGDHFISVSKHGHTFANKGRYPAQELTKYTFEQPMSGLNFVDSTLVRVAGRVTGGERENNKPIGFGKSVANLGKATITLSPVDDKYYLRSNSSDTTISSANNNISSKTIIKGQETDNQIVVTTDSATGEFLTVLPPIPYKVVNVSVGTEGTENYLGGTDFKISEIPHFTPNVNIEKTDSVIDETDTINETYKRFKFNHLLKINYRVDPTIFVTENIQSNGEYGDIPPVGDKQYPCGNNDVIDLYTNNEGTIEFALEHPVFTKSEQYTWKVSVFEKYINADNDNVDKVPITEKKLDISNALASTRVYLDHSDSVAHDPSELQLDSAGTALYSFKAGFPRMSGDHLLKASFALNNNGKTITKELEGYVVGAIPIPGNNFITQGPDIVQYVLRDPPGSNSYAYLEKGTTLETDFNLIRGGGLHSTTTLNEKFGVETVIGTGFGVIVEIETEAIAEASQEWDMTIERNNGHSTHTKVSSLNRITTSDSEEYVGAMADVYMGTSTNVVYGKVNTLGLYETNDNDGVTSTNNKHYKLNKKEDYSSDVTFTTMFNYTQNHIVDYLIPNVKKLRNDIIIKLKQGDPIPTAGETYKYYSYLDENDENFGKDGTYTVLAPVGLAEGQIVADTIKAMNSWIANWERVIADNEKAKLIAFADRQQRLEENISFDAGTRIERAKGRESSSTWTTIIEHHDEISIGGKTGLDVMGVGFELEQKLGALVNYEKTNANTSSNNKTYGYVLADNNQGDYFSVDVLNPQEGDKVIHKEEDIHFSENPTLYNKHKDRNDELWRQNPFFYTGLENIQSAKTGRKIDVIRKDKIKIVQGMVPDFYMEVDTVTTIINRAKGSYIFKLRAGQSSCPYEGPEYPLFCKQYYPDFKVDKKKYILSSGTFQIEKPELYVDNTKNASIANIPSGREGSFELKLSNQSDAALDVTYQLSVVSGSNPEGLILSIDGEPLTEPRLFNIESDETIKKTLKVKQSSLDVLEYKDVALQLTSVCQNDPSSDIGWIGDKININVEFVPSSSPVTLKVPKLLINLNNNKALGYTVSEYDTTFKNFASILVQYKAEHDQDWTPTHAFVYDDDLQGFEENQKNRIESHECRSLLDLSAEKDGVYNLRAVSRSHFGNDYIEVMSEEFKIIKDTKRPKPLGKPNPASGIYTGENEISVLFNEDIQSERITKDFLSVKGKLNGYPVKHSVAAKFIGYGAQTDASIALDDQSFSIGAWIQRDINKRGTLFAHGKDFSLSFTADNKIKVRLGEKVFTSNEQFTSKNWQYISFAYDNSAHRFSVMVLDNSNTTKVSFKGGSSLVQQDYKGSGLLYVGSEKDRSNGYSGAVHELTLWSKVRTEGNLSDINDSKTGRERNLIGYWRMDEGHGIMAKDISRSRHLILPNKSSWYLNNKNYAAQFDGQNSYHIPAGTIPFTEDDNFTIEFWFMGNKQSNVSLFACGDGIKDLNPNDRMSIGFDANSNLVLRAKGETNIISTNDLLDGNWHHYALNLVRNGYASTYIDGKLVNQLESSNIGEVSYSEYTIGASTYLGKDNTLHTERNFTGSIDEVRVWNATLSPSVIKHNIYNRMLGNEKGLAAYYPFEQRYKDEGNQTQHRESLAGFVSGKSKNATQIGGELFNKTNVAPLKEARADEEIASEKLSFVTSNNKILLNIDYPKYRLEGQIFEISLDRVLDLHGNKMKSLKWTVYFNQNSLKWNDDELNFIQEHLNSEERVITISNNGGKVVNWVISNIPEWLELSKTQGVLKPLEKTKIKVKTAASTPIGSYETTLLLKGGEENNKMFENLPVNLKVTGEKPDWSCNPDNFEFSMSVIGELRIDNQLSEDSEDILGAFVGNTCVGLASPKYFKIQNTFIVMMNVYGNKDIKGKDVTFKVWDASTGYTYPIVSSSQTVKMVNNKVYGEFYKPVIFNAEKQLQQRIHLADGWNWLSLNLLNNNMSVNNICEDIGSTTELIKAKQAFSVYGKSLWTGELDTLSINKMYKIKSKADVDFVCEGKPLTPSLHPITLNKGWNWIGYTPLQSIPLQSALADLVPVNGDVIKSKSSFAVYNGYEWVGLLEYMTPGNGYMYKSARVSTFHYPDVYVPTSYRMKSGKINIYKPKTDNYSGNMSIIAQVIGNNGVLSNYELGAFVKDECRGTSQPKDNDLVFLTVAGDDDKNDSISFKVYDYSKSKELEIKEIKIKYENDKILGSLNKPYIIRLRNATGIESLMSNNTNNKIKIYPNPTKGKFTVEVATDCKIEIITNSGQILEIKDLQKGRNELNINEQGIYFIKFEGQGIETTEKVIVNH